MARKHIARSRSSATPRRFRILRLLLILILLLGMALGGLIYWFSTGTRSLPILDALVSSQINSLIAPYHANIDHLAFKLDRKSWLLATDIQNVLITDKDDKRVARIPQIRLSLSAPALLIGQTEFKRMEISSPRVHVRRDAAGHLTFSVQDEQGTDVSTPVTLESAMGGLAGSIRQMRVRQLIFTNVLIGVDQPDGSLQRWELPKASLRFTKHSGGVQIASTILIKNEGFNTQVKSTSAIGLNNKDSHHELTFRRLPAALVTMLHPTLAPLRGLEILFSGGATLTTTDETISAIDVTISAEKGTYENADVLPEKLTIDKLAFVGSTGKGFAALDIKSAELVTPDVTVTAKGKLGLTTPMTADVEITATKLPFSKIASYWPKDLNAASREWVVANLTDGTMEKAVARILIKPGDLEQETTPASVLLANLTVTGATVQYLPKYPPVKNVDGEIEITARGLTITSEKGTAMTGTVLKKAHLAIEDFSAPGIPMSAILDLTTPANDVATFIGPDVLDIAKSMKFNPATITGNADGHIELFFPLYSDEAPEGKKDIVYDIKASLTDVSQDKVMGKWNISKLNGDLALTNKELILTSKTGLQGIPVTLNVTSAVSGPDNTSYEFAAIIPAQKLSMFNFTPPDFLKGELDIHAKVTETAKESKTDATIDIKNAILDFDDIGLTKPAGKPGTLKATIISDGVKEVTPSFEITSEGIHVKGSMTKDKKTDDIITLNIPTLQYGKTDVAIVYEPKGALQVASIIGKRLDLDTDDTPSSRTAPADTSNPIDKLKNISVKLDVGELHFSKTGHLSNVKLDLLCGAVTCSSASLDATTQNNKPFTFRLTTIANGSRQTTMSSPDAGGVLKAFGITDHMTGGELTYQATFDDALPNHPQKGGLLITDFTIVNGPILTRIVSLASITGVLDLLSGKGLSFKKLSGETSFDGDTAKVSKGKAYGSALGITFAGNIKPFQNTLNLKGTVVPSYTANSMLGEIPILGKLLVGGEGEGIIAARYSVKGNVDKPDVGVNPLSLLTPGFLRNLFDVFDAPEEKEKPKPTAATPAPSTTSAPATSTSPNADPVPRTSFPSSRSPNLNIRNRNP